ncbi:MAG: HD domain-containing protein [Lachnospiraceae bacterium]|nr:HD domain-containing protein [Lachnospiraceae bacterium]
MPQTITDFYKDYLARINEIDMEEQRLLSSDDKRVWTEHLVRKSNLIRNSHSVVEKNLNEMIRPYVSGERETGDDEAAALRDGAMLYYDKALFDEVMESSVLKMLIERYARRGDAFSERMCRYAFANNAYISAEGPFSERSLAEARQVMSRLSDIRAIRAAQPFDALFLREVNSIVETGFSLFDRECKMLEPDTEQIVKRYNELAGIEKYKDILPADWYKDFTSYLHDCLGIHVVLMQALHWEGVPEKRRKSLSSLLEKELLRQTALAPAKRNPKLFMASVVYAFHAGTMKPDACFDLLYPYLKALKKKVNFASNNWYDYHGVSRFFAICLMTRPLLQMVTAGELTERRKKQKIAGILYEVKNYIETIPRECAGRENMDYCLYHLLYDVIEFVDDEAMAIECIDTLMMNRQLATLIHSIMAAKLTQAILDPLMDQKPELFYEMLGVGTPEEVHAKKEDLALFMYNAARVHDIGKIRIATIINTQIRSISPIEFELIKMHSQWSYDIVKRNKKLSQYGEIVLGHHKSYDGKSGYPADYDNHATKYRLLTDILTICDSMDAATDVYGRNYLKDKHFDKVFAEFEELKGTRYNPVIIDFIRDNEELYKQLQKITSKEAREDFYFHIYRKYR